MQLVHEGEKKVPYDGDRFAETEGGTDGGVGESKGKTEGDGDG